MTLDGFLTLLALLATIYALLPIRVHYWKRFTVKHAPERLKGEFSQNAPGPTNTICLPPYITAASNEAMPHVILTQHRPL